MNYKKYLRVCLIAFAAVALTTLCSVTWAKGSVPSTTTTLTGYQTGTGATAGHGSSPAEACGNYFQINGYAGYSPPVYQAVAQPTACQIVWVSNGSTYQYILTHEIVQYVPMCGTQYTPLPRCDCPTGEEPNRAGTVCVASSPVVNTEADMCVADGTKIGNPVIPLTGEKILSDEDYSDTTAHGLSFIRTYKSLRNLGAYTGSPSSNLDTNWSHNHSVNLIADGANRQVIFGDGRVSSFAPGTTTLAWTSLNAADSLSQNTATGNWTYVNKAGDTQWLFGADGKAQTATLRNGWTTSYGYSTASTPSSIAPVPGLLITVTNHFGRVMNLKYDAAKTISRVDFPDGRYANYYYDYSSRMLYAVEWAAPRYRGYLYEVSGKPWLLTGTSDSNGRHSTYAYDSSGRAISTQLAGGADLYTVAYPTGSDRVVTDPLGTQRTFSYSTNRGNLAVTGATYPSDKGLSDAATRTQDANGLITSQTDFLGVVNTTTWDAARQLPLSVTRASGRPEAQTVDYQWHASQSLPVGITESGRATAYSYDANGNKLSETVTDLATSATRTTQWTYGTSSLPATMTDPKGGVWQFAHDALGNLTSLKNPLNHETVLAYDSGGRLTQETAPNGLVTTYTWNSKSELTSKSVGGEVTYYYYDANQRLYYVTAPDGHTVYFYRDNTWRITSVTDNWGNVLTYTLDAAGNRVGETLKDSSNTIALAVTRVVNTLNRVSQVKDAANNATTLAYNANGDLTGQTDPLSHTTSQSLDGLRRPTATTFADSTSASQAWNALDQVTSVTDAKSVQTTYTRNAFGEVMSEASPDIGTISYVRDALGAVTQRTDAKGNVTSISRDALGRPTSVQYGASHIVTYTYDTAPSGTPNQKGYLSKIEDPSGATTYERDLQGRITKKTQLVNDNPGSPSSFAYTYWWYNGNLREIGYPGGFYVHYARTSNGKLYKVQTWLPGASSYGDFATNPTFTALGQPKSWDYTSGATASRTYNADGRMTANEFAGYGYDAAGRITGITQSLAATTGTDVFTTTLTWAVGYDSRNRVTSFARAGAGASYTYDANSNRLTSVESYSSDSDLDGSFTGTDATRINAKALDIGTSSNRLLGFTQTITSTSAGSTTSVVTTPISYSLDANGSMTSDGLRSFDYDEADRLAKVRVIQSGEAASVSYLTNGLGQRVFKGEPVAEQTLPNEATLGSGFIAWLQAKFRWMFEAAQASTSVGTAYVYSDGGLPSWALLGEYDNGSASGTGKTEYIWLPSPDGNAIPIGMRRNSQFYSIHTDHLGTPRLMKDASNTTVWQWPYSAFGNNRPVGVLSAVATAGYTVTAGPSALKTTTPTMALNFRFPGQYYDWETGLFYNYFRNFDPRTGRYPQADPIGMDGGWNRFGYVEGNPLSFVDPLGLQAQANLFDPADPAFSAASQVPSGDTNDVYGHGGSRGMWRGPLDGGRYMTPKELSDLLRKSPGFRPDLSTRLLGCDVGKGAYCQQVANELGGAVQCYDNTVWYGTRSKWIFMEEGTVDSYSKSFPNGPKTKPVPNYSSPGNLTTSQPRRRK